MIDFDTVVNLISYCPQAGSVEWSYRPRGMFSSLASYASWNAKYANRRAGSVGKDRHGKKIRKITILGETYQEHRIIWLYMTGSWPSDQIDHINQDSTDNRWANLRESDAFKNMKNRPMQKTNTSGVTGVSWCSVRSKWRARPMADGKRVCLGYFDDLDIAAMEALEFYKDNGFTEIHGRQR